MFYALLSTVRRLQEKPARRKEERREKNGKAFSAYFEVDEAPCAPRRMISVYLTLKNEEKKKCANARIAEAIAEGTETMGRLFPFVCSFVR